MLYRALISFTGQVTMAAGEEREIPVPAFAEDLIKAGYIEPVQEEEKEKKAAKKKTAK